MEKKRTYDEFIKKEVEKPNNLRNKIINRRGNMVEVRKYHMTESQMEKLRERFSKSIKDVDDFCVNRAGRHWFNPYRQLGIFNGCVQSLFLLGANEWYSFNEVLKTLEKYMKTLIDKDGRDSWSKFKDKNPREKAYCTRDYIGRIQHNMTQLQKISGLHCFGYKLRQLCSCIDIKRDKEGIFYYRLNTQFESEDQVNPIYDTSQYEKMEKRGRPSKKRLLDNVEIRKDIKKEDVSIEN